VPSAAAQGIKRALGSLYADTADYDAPLQAARALRQPEGAAGGALARVLGRVGATLSSLPPFDRCCSRRRRKAGEGSGGGKGGNAPEIAAAAAAVAADETDEREY
jgi:hypothetical protein